MSVPDALIERLDKAQGHINAVDRRLWNETERGLWSGHQAVARVAEAWFSLHGLVSDLPPVEKYLPREVMGQRLDDFTRAAAGTSLAARLREIADSGAAILAEPFLNHSNEDRAALEAGLARKHRYLDALRNLLQAVEDEIADRFVSLRPGDWARLPDGYIGRLIHRPGLSGWFFVPSIALTAPDDASKGWCLYRSRIEPVAVGHDMPIGEPAWYWLLAAHRRRQEAERMAGTDWITMRDLHAGLNAILDAGAKAWLITTDPGSRWVHWSQIYAQQHVPRLAGTAPGAVAGPLVEALRRNEAMSMQALRDYGRMPPGWKQETTEILRLAAEGTAALERLLEPRIDLAVGQWVQVPPHGEGRVAQRDGLRLVLDLGRLGVIVTSLFHTPILPIAVPTDFAPPTEPHHARWLWFACHPEVRGGCGVCPCCGLPGIQGGEPRTEPCRLCGWSADGGDADPQRRSPVNGGLDLALARRRFEALGYAVVPAGLTAEQAAVWLDPRVLAVKQRLVTALSDLTGDDTVDGAHLDRIGTLWDDYQAALGRFDREGRTDW